MLEPHKITAGMAFPKDYIMTGNKREQVKQAGNAVTPPAARDLIAIRRRVPGLSGMSRNTCMAQNGIVSPSL